MSNNVYDILDQFYQYELQISEIYASFTYMFEEDNEFWWKISLEEKNHASLVASVKQVFAPAGKIPSMLDTIDIENIIIENKKLTEILAHLKDKVPNRKEAFKIAIELENSAVENHYQEFMESEGGSQIDRMFRELNNYDKDHVARISEYMKENGI